MFDLLVKAYGADPRIRDNAGKTPRQYMMASSQLQGGDMQVSWVTILSLNFKGYPLPSTWPLSNSLLLTLNTKGHTPCLLS